MRLLVQLHRWVGLALAAIVAVVACSGGLLLLRDPYYRFVHPELARETGAAEVSRRAEVLGAIEDRFRARHIRLVKFPGQGINAYQVWLADGGEAFVNARTGEVIDEWHWNQRVPAFLFELHAHLVREPEGTVVNGIAALGAVFMVLTGIVLWWPRRGALPLRQIIPRRVTPASLLRSHAATGALAALPVLLFAGSGAAIVFYDEVSGVVTALLDERDALEPRATVAPRVGVAEAGWSERLVALDATMPDGAAVFYYPGTAANAALTFRKRLDGEWHPNGRSYVRMDPYSGQVIEAIDARSQGRGTRLMHAVYPVHAAKVGGTAMTLVAALSAMALTWLAAGGVWVWGRRITTARR